MKLLSTLFSILIFIPLFSFASEPNAGFVQGLWYSSEPVFVGVPTRIYVAVRNNTEHDLTGTVRFMDNDVRIGSSEISALSGRLVEAWVDWTPTDGEHNISAIVTDAELHVIGGKTESIDVGGVTAEDSVIVDFDTDKDGVGNATDTDDDNDSILDTDEKARGSNPLVPNPATKEIPKAEEAVTEIIDEETDEEVSTEEGLEQYVSDGIADSLLGNATEKIENAQESLDAYREKRNEALANKKDTATNDTKEETALGSTATITRTQLEPKESLLNSFITSVASLLSLVWTFVLWVTSRGLSNPALIEVLLLLGIVYMVYRIARRFGRRPNY
jgi:hypothetical protein